ncbi:MAG: phage integrase SAM-like domain-containing protein [Flavisolibacter sp.]
MGITVEPLLNYRNKVNKSGRYPIHLRVTINGHQRYYPIKVPLKVAPNQWTGKNDSWVKNTHPYAFEINNKILEKKTIITDLIRRCYTLNRPVSFFHVDRELNRKGDRTVFNDYVRNYIDNPPEHVNLDAVTWEKYEASLGHLNNFQSRILLSEIDASLIARFRNYLLNLEGRKGKMDPATVKSYFDKLKVIVTYAAKREHLLDIREAENWFEEVKISVPKKKEGQHLEIEELQRLRKLQFSPKESSLERDRDLFLFQVYTGFYYNDMQILRKDQLFKDIEHGYYIIGERDKNGNPTIIPLFKFAYAGEILSKYQDSNPEGTLLFSPAVFIEVQAYNRNLKLLAKKAGIYRHLSNKTARHTNAQMWVRFGAERPVVSRMLGHEKEQTTENYYRVGLREIIEGTRSVDFEKFSI